MLFRIGLVIAVAGGFGIHHGLKEKRLADASSGQAEKVSLKDLIARGPDGNANIILTEYAPCGNFVYSKSKRGDTWQTAWVPVIPQQDVMAKLGAVGKQLGNEDKLPTPEEMMARVMEAARPTAVKALVKTTHAKNQAELDARIDKEELPAIVVNRIESIGSKEQEILRQNYPGTDFSTCLIIEEGRALSSGSTALMYIAAGAVGILVGLLMIVLPWLKKR